MQNSGGRLYQLQKNENLLKKLQQNFYGSEKKIKQLLIPIQPCLILDTQIKYWIPKAVVYFYLISSKVDVKRWENR